MDAEDCKTRLGLLDVRVEITREGTPPVHRCIDRAEPTHQPAAPEVVGPA